MNTNIRFAFLFMMAIAVWFGSGLFVTSKPKQAVEPLSTPTNVQVLSINHSLYSPSISLRARTEPNRSVNIVAQINGKISKVLVNEGMPVITGQPICEIDPEDRYLRLSEAEAHLNQSDIAYRGALKLKTAGYQSELAIAQAKAMLEAAEANFKRAQLNVSFLQIVAPFDGFVEARPLEIGDYVVPGKVCASIIDLDPIKVTSMVNENEIASISVSSPTSVSINNGPAIAAQINFMAHQADKMTRGYRLEAVAPNADSRIRAGLTSRLEIRTDGVLAHLIPSSATLLNDAGGIVVRVLGNDNITASLPVQILGEEAAGIWVSGLPRQVDLITVGQNYVVDGELVKPSFLVNNGQQ
ncbi:MAG: efflux RND transporter periplasmic adaptor subunit [Porticoccaceae bacterium]|nr:efflux RND transporter periplasmic adaptor subunit [Porticoccaceae bacterium]